MIEPPPFCTSPEITAKTWDRLNHLGTCSDTASGLTRLFLGPGMKQAAALLRSWMSNAGLIVQEDDWGNIFARTACRPDRPLLVIGSHFDTVPNAGKYDGALGILVGLAALEALGTHTWSKLPFDIELASFSEEEGARFQTTYLGSRAALGLITPQDLMRVDAHNTTLASLIPPQARQPAARYRPGDLIAYWEIHIEQGPVLESQNLALGLVTGIAGQTRAKLSWHGRSAHGGTCPMNLRHDALTGAAAFILDVEQIARQTPGLVATVGCLDIPHSAPNVVPGIVHLTLDVRHLDSPTQKAALARLQSQAHYHAESRRLTLHWQTVQDTQPVACHTEQTDLLDRAISAVQPSVPRLASGAGHDAVIMAQIAPIGMIFVRCASGLSHHPDESVLQEDVQKATDALVYAIRLLAHRLPNHHPNFPSEQA